MTPKWLDKRGPIKTLESVWIPLILLKTENQEYCSKIIFKCVNNAVRPIFNKKKLLNKKVCGSRKQYTGSIEN